MCVICIEIGAARSVTGLPDSSRMLCKMVLLQNVQCWRNSSIHNVEVL